MLLLNSEPFSSEEKVMSETPKFENVADWLRDAYAMEQQAETMLTSQAGRLEHYPKLRARIEQHIEETRGQQELIKGCLDRLGESPSTIKDLGAKIMAMGQGVSGMFVSDEVVKGAMAGYVFEHLEIASYTSLIAAAKAIGDTETQRVCEQILPQEQAMAKWLLEHIPELTTAFLERAADPDTESKR
jgi:ferritin-like metal-binding protein YciE